MEAREFGLREPDTFFISLIRHFRPIRGGGFIVIDRSRDEVRIHARDGSLERVVAREGEGPGELKAPLEAMIARDRHMYVVENSPRVTRFNPDFSFDTLFRLPVASVGKIESLGSNLVLRIGAQGVRDKVVTTTREGSELHWFHPANPEVWKVPYWQSFSGEEIAVGRGRIFVADDFLYPLYMYDDEGKLLRTFGSPPASWVEAPRPRAGEFVGPGSMERLDRWLRSFTEIRRLDVYTDSLLLVTHSRYDPQPGDFYHQVDIGLDIYNLDGQKLYEDVEPPGRVLRAADSLYILLGEPPEGWRIGVFRLQALERSGRPSSDRST